ncbi:MAG: DUF2442 domain-containing protein [Schwartzia sp.]|nr:DUF2442 domain-containing protein [Schwartzia sp. (in: firmicutes)]
MIRPTSVKPTSDYKLLLTFSTGEQRIFDVRPYLDMPFFAKLKDKDIFNQVFVNEYTVEWKNGCDIAPHELYDDSVPIGTYPKIVPKQITAATFFSSRRIFVFAFIRSLSPSAAPISARRRWSRRAGA